MRTINLDSKIHYQVDDDDVLIDDCFTLHKQSFNEQGSGSVTILSQTQKEFCWRLRLMIQKS